MLGLRALQMLAVALLLSPVLPLATGHAAEQDHPILLEVVHLQEDRLAFQASCEVTDGLGTTRTSSFAGQTNSFVRFVGTGVACRLRTSDAGSFKVTLRAAETVLAQAQGGASDLVTVAAR